MSDLYQEIILEEMKHPAHQGELVDADVTEAGVNASCGDQVTVYVRQSGQADERISDLTWTGQGCAISMATMSLLARQIHQLQLTARQVADLTDTDLLELLGLTEISPGRVKCMQLGLRTTQRAIEKTAHS